MDLPPTDADHPLTPTLDELQASLARSRADVAAGRTVPLDQVLADMRAELAGVGQQGSDKAGTAA